MQNLAERDPEQDTNGVDSQNQVQTTQSSGKDTHVVWHRDPFR